MAFSEKLKALRLKNGLTQDELGEKLYLSRTSISYYEQGKFEPTMYEFFRLPVWHSIFRLSYGKAIQWQLH